MGMTREEFLKFHEDFTGKMRSICVRKNNDYAGAGGEDAFANFSRVEAMGIAKTEQGFLTRMLDKMSRLSTFVESGELLVKDESVEDTLVDLANYSALLAGFIASKKKMMDGLFKFKIGDKVNPFNSETAVGVIKDRRRDSISGLLLYVVETETGSLHELKEGFLELAK
jgi:hypothetical protein